MRDHGNRKGKWDLKISYYWLRPEHRVFARDELSQIAVVF